MVVIGAGLAGCSAAWHLARRGARVLLLEQGDQPGAEASAQNAGMLRRLAGHECERDLARRSFAFMVDPPEDWEDSPPSARTGAILAMAEEIGFLDAGVADLRRAGVRVETCLRPPVVAPAMAGSPTLWAWHLPDERVVDPHALIGGFVRGLRRRGGVMSCGVRALEIEAEGARVVGVRTSHGTVAAPLAVLAAGAWTGALATALGLHRPLVPMARTLLHTRPHPLSSPEHPWCWFEDVGVYVRPEAGGWLLSGCEETRVPAPEGPGSLLPADEQGRAMALDKAERLFPALGRVSIGSGWAGLRTFAPDRRPYLGSDPELAGLWWAAALGGSGLSCAVGLGEALAAWMAGEETRWLDRSEVSPGRPLPTEREFMETAWTGGVRPDLPPADALYPHEASATYRRLQFAQENPPLPQEPALPE